MPETIEDKKVFSLLEVLQSVEKTLKSRYGSGFWVMAEMNKLNYYSHSGHCYPDLVQKHNEKVIAQIRAVLWKKDYLKANARFLEILKEPLKDGIKILFFAKISFTPVHGLSLTISEIDASYTLGDLEKEKQLAVKRLHKEGLYNKNKKLSFPFLPQRIAVISVETSKGFADFSRILVQNPFGYKFFVHLFPSLLQGDRAADNISRQLQRIARVKGHFDVVAIIRGGGGEVGLSCYNQYELAAEIANFPLPVITGIGHATNETVAEMVAYENAITPTKLAEFLMQKIHEVALPVKEAERKLIHRSRHLLLEKETALKSEVKMFRSVTENALNRWQHTLATFSAAIVRQTDFRFKNEISLLGNFSTAIERQCMQLISKNRTSLLHQMERLHLHSHLKIKTERRELENHQKNLDNLNPANVLKRGYSLTHFNGETITASSQLQEGDLITTVFAKGEVESRVERVNKNSSHE